VEAKTIARALKLLETQKKASKAYYLRHKEVVKAKSVAYWEEHRRGHQYPAQSSVCVTTQRGGEKKAGG
jgi:hypothetical protein